MTYRATDESSTQTAAERASEAKRILDMGIRDRAERMTQRERDFLASITTQACTGDVSIKQLWWLRDLHSRYVVGA